MCNLYILVLLINWLVDSIFIIWGLRLIIWCISCVCFLFNMGVFFSWDFGIFNILLMELMIKFVEIFLKFIIKICWCLWCVILGRWKCLCILMIGKMLLCKLIIFLIKLLVLGIWLMFFGIWIIFCMVWMEMLNFFLFNLKIINCMLVLLFFRIFILLIVDILVFFCG